VLQLLGLLIVAFIYLDGRGHHVADRIARTALSVASRRHAALVLVGLFVLGGNVIVALITGEPVPSVHDEFSYLLAADTFASLRVSNPSPPSPEFFDTFYVLVSPHYVSKYFPGQGMALAIGQLFTGHPIAGVWLSSSLACMATCWMIQAWIGRTAGLAGGLLMAIHWGICSYWSQSYWGGMVAAGGGAVFYGAAHRLWHSGARRHAFLLALGFATLLVSRPVEGALATVPVAVVLGGRIWSASTTDKRLVAQLAFPIVAVVGITAFACVWYNVLTTGSPTTTAYALHERQYQETPPFVFLPRREAVVYSSDVVERYYKQMEGAFYESKRGIRLLVINSFKEYREVCDFYFGLLLLTPVLLVTTLSPRTDRRWQLANVLGLVACLPFLDHPAVVAVFCAAALLQVAMFIRAINAFWPKLAVVSCLIAFSEGLIVKVFLPHYVASVAPLVVCLQVECLRRLWYQRRSGTDICTVRPGMTMSMHLFRYRVLALALPLALVSTTALEMASRITGARLEGPSSLLFLEPRPKWSLRRRDVQQSLEALSAPQLVFVRYRPDHDLRHEWVYNHAALPEAHVTWARDLGEAANRELVSHLPGRNVWLLDADSDNPQPVPYLNAASAAMASNREKRRSLPW
jgi:hypothetical protein